ncbi:MAG: hypothetical protein KDK44_05930, partial [Chlamydiia bacterium]|nr:hypothetical protein [Chlamydiia bacterium]
MKWGLVFFAGVLLSLITLLGFRTGTHEKVIEAEKFVLRSPHGRILMELRVEDHKPVIALCDERGKERLHLEGGSAPGILIKNGSDKTVMQIRDFEKDGSGFV